MWFVQLSRVLPNHSCLLGRVWKLTPLTPLNQRNRCCLWREEKENELGNFASVKRSLDTS